MQENGFDFEKCSKIINDMLYDILDNVPEDSAFKFNKIFTICDMNPTYRADTFLFTLTLKVDTFQDYFHTLYVNITYNQTKDCFTKKITYDCKEDIIDLETIEHLYLYVSKKIDKHIDIAYTNLK